MSEIKKYHRILNNKEMDFLKKYTELPEIKRLKYIGYFSGMDFCSKDIYKFLNNYSRFDHSLSVANMTYNFTDGNGKLRKMICKTKTISSFFHDITTPATSDTEDYRNSDSLNQIHTERNTYDVITNSKKIKEYLEDDMIDIEDIVNPSVYSIVDSDMPKLSTDRLDGLFMNNYLWFKTITLEEIKEIYKNLIVVENESGEDEIGTKDKDTAIRIAHLGLNTGYSTLEYNDVFAMNFLANIINLCIDYGIISEEELKVTTDYDLFKKVSRVEIKEIRDLWYTFTHMKKIKVQKEIFKKLKDHHYIKYSEKDIKKRYVDPLVVTDNKTYRISEIDGEINKKIEKLKKLDNEYYVYTKVLRR